MCSSDLGRRGGDFGEIAAVTRRARAEPDEDCQYAEPAAELYRGPEADQRIGPLTGINAKGGAERERHAKQDGERAAADGHGGEFDVGRLRRARLEQAPIILQSADVCHPKRDVAGGDVRARRVHMPALVVEVEIRLEGF